MDYLEEWENCTHKIQYYTCKISFKRFFGYISSNTAFILYGLRYLIFLFYDQMK